VSQGLLGLSGRSAYGRVIGVDLGERRVGVAVSDAARSMAVPYDTLSVVGEGPASLDTVLAALVALVDEIGATAVVVGLPLSLDGQRTAAARRAELAMGRLRDALGERLVTVEGFDERLTTVTAHQALAAAGWRSRARRTMVDQVAAAVLLQAWLDAQPRGAVQGDLHPGSRSG